MRSLLFKAQQHIHTQTVSGVRKALEPQKGNKKWYWVLEAIQSKGIRAFIFILLQHRIASAQRRCPDSNREAPTYTNSLFTPQWYEIFLHRMLKPCRGHPGSPQYDILCHPKTVSCISGHSPENRIVTKKDPVQEDRRLRSL